MGEECKEDRLDRLALKLLNLSSNAILFKTRNANLALLCSVSSLCLYAIYYKQPMWDSENMVHYKE